MALLSNYIAPAGAAGAVPDYIEYAWVSAPSDSPQTITENAYTTLSCTKLVQNTGSASVVDPVGSVFTLPAGTYYYEAYSRLRTGTDGDGDVAFVFSLYNTTDGAYVSRSGLSYSTGLNFSGSKPGNKSVCPYISGQFKITTQKSFSLRILVNVGVGTVVLVDNGSGEITLTDATANSDQRTTIKLWKLS